MSVSLAMALKKERSVTASRGVDKNGPSGRGDAGGDNDDGTSDVADTDGGMHT